MSSFTIVYRCHKLNVSEFLRKAVTLKVCTSLLGLKWTNNSVFVTSLN